MKTEEEVAAFVLKIKELEEVVQQLTELNRQHDSQHPEPPPSFGVLIELVCMSMAWVMGVSNQPESTVDILLKSSKESLERRLARKSRRNDEPSAN